MRICVLRIEIMNESTCLANQSLTARMRLDRLST